MPFGKNFEMGPENTSSEEENLESSQERKVEEGEQEVEETEKSKEKIEAFESNLGVSFKEGEDFGDVKNHLEFVEKNNLQETQLNLRKDVNLEEIRPLITEFRENHPEVNLSFHLKSPSFSEEEKIVNSDSLKEQINFSYECGAELITLHPADIKMEDYVGLSNEKKNKMFEKSAEFLSDNISRFVTENNGMAFTIENMGQTPEEMSFFLNLIQSKLMDSLEKEGVNSSEAEEMASRFADKNLGITLDVNHALHENKKEFEEKTLSELAEVTGKDEKEIRKRWKEKEDILKELPEGEKEEVEKVIERTKQEMETKNKPILENWFDKFRNRIKCLHVFTPTIENKEKEENFQGKFAEVMDLYNKYHLEAPVYLETKKEPEVTQTAFNSAREEIKERLE